MAKWERTIEIEASPARVWEVMADVARWPQWTASIISLESPAGGMALGAAAKVHARGTPKSTFRVSEWQPGERFTWETKVRGVRSVAHHIIEPAGQGRSRVKLAVELEGLMATLSKPFLNRRIVENLELESAGLKRESERMPAVA
jgi:hypothetical protein